MLSMVAVQALQPMQDVAMQGDSGTSTQMQDVTLHQPLQPTTGEVCLSPCRSLTHVPSGLLEAHTALPLGARVLGHLVFGDQEQENLVDSLLHAAKHASGACRSACPGLCC